MHRLSPEYTLKGLPPTGPRGWASAKTGGQQQAYRPCPTAPGADSKPVLTYIHPAAKDTCLNLPRTFSQAQALSGGRAWSPYLNHKRVLPVRHLESRGCADISDGGTGDAESGPGCLSGKGRTNQSSCVPGPAVRPSVHPSLPGEMK